MHLIFNVIYTYVINTEYLEDYYTSLHLPPNKTNTCERVYDKVLTTKKNKLVLEKGTIAGFFHLSTLFQTI